MNQKRAKAIRKMAQLIAANKGLTDKAYREMPVGLKATQRVVAADTERGQYRALKKAVGAYY